MADSVKVIRTERIWLKQNRTLERLTHISKNLYNEGNYVIRQTYFKEKRGVKFTELIENLSGSENYQKLPEITAKKIVGILDKNWNSFFKSRADWKIHPENYFRKPKIPKYKMKNGAFLLPLSKQQISINSFNITLKEFGNIKIKRRFSSKRAIIGGRIVPKGIGYFIELLYKKSVPYITHRPPTRIMGIDLGITNLITMVNNIGHQPIVIKGGVVKSINQYYNKKRGNLQRVYAKQEIKYGKKYSKLLVKRNRKINNFFHEISFKIINLSKKQNIDTIIIGYNKGWKQKTSLGKKTNQNFNEIPFHRLVHMIRYKAEDTGIRVIQAREDYTSKCSFLDKEPIMKQSEYMGDRIYRGLFKSKKGRLINSDANGAYNIIKKAVPNAFIDKENADGIEGVWLHPVRWRKKGQPILC